MRMRSFVAARLLAAVVFVAALSGVARSEESLTSSMDMMFDAVASYDGIRIVATGLPGKNYTEDHSPPQVLEIVRPSGMPITVGRLATSCGCLVAGMEKKSFGPGERAYIEVRTVKPPPVPGATYAIFAQLVSPYQTALQYDFEMESVGPRFPVAGGGTVFSPRQ